MKKYFPYFAPLIFFALFLVDGQLSTLLSNVAPGTISITSHLLLIVGMYAIDAISLPYSIVLFTFLGIIYDIYYIGVLGMSTTLLPLLMYMVYYFAKHIQLTWLTKVSMLVVLVFAFEFTSFLLARLFQLTNLSMFIFVFYNLMPSLVYNVVFLLLFQPLLEKIFGITNKT